MSARLTVQSLINARVHELVNLGEDDPRFYQYINSFQERALNYGRWWGTTQLVEFCVTPSSTGSGVCLVLPREVAVVEAMTLNGMPIQPKNAWYSYITPHRPTGCGTANCAPNLYCGCGCGCGPYLSEDKLTVASFDVTSTGQTIRFYFNPADVGKKIIVQGYDENNVWVRSTIDGTVQDGEEVTLALTGGQPYTDTSTAWYVGSPQAIIKEATSYNVSMFAVDEDGEVAQQLANYQPTETHPQYRKVFIPGFRTSCGCAEGGRSSLRAIVSLQHIPVSQPNDWLLFQSIPAYEDGVQAVRYWREGDRNQGDLYFFGGDSTPRNGRGVLRVTKRSGAIPTLQAEERKMTGDLTTVQVRRSGVLIPGFI